MPHKTRIRIYRENVDKEDSDYVIEFKGSKLIVSRDELHELETSIHEMIETDVAWLETITFGRPLFNRKEENIFYGNHRDYIL